jgi:hypothetical protein
LPTRTLLFHHGLRAGLFVQGLVGSVLGLLSALLIPAFQFRLEAQRDAKVYAILAVLLTVLATLEAAIVAAWSASRSGAPRVRRVRRRAVVLAFALPVAVTACAVEGRLWLLEHDDPLYGYVERGLARTLAQRGIGSEISLAVEDGRLTLAVPAYLARRGRWWVEVDAHDTLGRSCPLRSAATFGDEPIILRIPVPLASEEIPGRKFELDPGSIVIVRGVRFTLDGETSAVFVRQFERVYEAPTPRIARRLQADFVGHQR